MEGNLLLSLYVLQTWFAWDGEINLSNGEDRGLLFRKQEASLDWFPSVDAHALYGSLAPPGHEQQAEPQHLNRHCGLHSSHGCVLVVEAPVRSILRLTTLKNDRISCIRTHDWPLTSGLYRDIDEDITCCLELNKIWMVAGLN